MQYNRCDIHNHTYGSNMRLRDALASPEALIDRAIEIGLCGIGISDHEFLGMTPRANKYFQENILTTNPNFKVLLCNEIYLVDERPSDKHWHFLLTAKDEIGYKQMKRLSSLAWLNSYTTKGMERVDTLKTDLQNIIAEDPGHIIASTACIGSELGQRILSLTAAEKLGDTQTAAEEHNAIVNFLLWCKDVFKDDLYIEAQPGVSKEQILVNRRLISVANAFNIKMIPTSDTHYLKPEDRYVHKAFLNSENKEREVDAFYQDAYLHTNEQMIEKFKASDYDEAYVLQMFDNSMEIYDKVQNFSLSHTQQIPKVDVEDYPKKEFNHPEYPNLTSMFKSDDKIERYWVNKCIDKLKEIDKFNETYLKELEEEADVKTIIGKKLDTNMFAYPVTLAHYIDLIWDCGSSVGVGRGSACSALNHYLLGITQLDPIEWNFPFFRYMNRDTEGLGDIDIDVCSTKVQKIIKKIREERGKKFLPEIDDISRENLGAVYVCTFGTETSKSAVITACRGYRSEDYPDGIDVDIAQYLSSLIPSERGFVWPLKDVYYGNPEKDRKPIALFVNTVDSYPGLFSIMLGIEGIVNKRSRHASGVLFMNEDPYEFNCFMKTPSGEIVTQYDLHDAEWCGSTKMDILVTEIQDKIVQTLQFLQEYHEVEGKSLREVYNNYLLPSVMDIEDKDTWNTIQNASSLDLFQLDSPIGRQGAKKVKPKNMKELSATNGVIRLMTQEKGAETPLDKYVRFKNDISNWENEMSKYNLAEKEKAAVRPYLEDTSGIGISQEQLMRVLMDKDICNFTLKEANKARKIVSKKKMTQIPELKTQIFEKATSKNLANYIWDSVVATQLGYAFSDIHSMSYSFIGYQSAYLATTKNPIYWNTSCLIINSGMVEDEDIDADEETKEKQTDYAKNAKALGNIISAGITVSLVDINKSDFSFKPNIETNEILYGMQALSGINKKIIEKIKSLRPFYSLKDFMTRCPLDKRAMISLIKSGAFDKLSENEAKEFNIEPRIYAMTYYLLNNCDAKKKITLQNMNGLIANKLLPQEMDLYVRIYNFNGYLKLFKKGLYYTLDEAAYNFYYKNFDLSKINVIQNIPCIAQSTWDNIYKKAMDPLRDYIKSHQQDILNAYNDLLFKNAWDKYAQGTISAWEMESMCFYYHEHELAHIDVDKYGISDFNTLPEEPIVEKTFKRGINIIPIFKTYKIIGTVIGKDDNRSSISLLTPTGVVNVKFTKEYYAMYSRQISEKQEDGTKKVIEKGWFKRGTKVMCTGFRREDTFVCKSYKHTPTHQLYLIEEVTNNGRDMILKHERQSVEGE